MNTIDETSSLNVAPPAEADQNATLAIAKSSVSATSEHLLRLFIGRTPAAIALFDTEMRYLIASQRYIVDYRIEGIDTPDGLIGQRHYDLFPDIPARWRDVHARVLAGETLSADEDPFPRADGRVDWVHWEMLPWYQPNGSVGGAILFSEVITERVEAARALAEGEARLNLAQSAGNIGTWAAR